MSAGAAVRFKVTDAGAVDYDTALDSFVAGRGTPTLIVRGYSVNVDASPTSYPRLIVSGFSTWADAHVVQPVVLVPGPHALAFSGGGGPARFRVTDAGTVDYDPAQDAYLSGRGTPTLTVRGYTVNVDASATSYPAVMLLGPSTWTDAHALQHFVLVPGLHTLVFYNGGVARFRVTDAGTVDYDPVQEGYLSGRGTPTLLVRGYPVDIDARATSYRGFLISGVTGWLDARIVQHFRLVPGVHAVVLPGGRVVRFTVTDAGVMDYDAALDGVLSGRGTTTLTFKSDLPAAGVVNWTGGVQRGPGGGTSAVDVSGGPAVWLWLAPLLGVMLGCLGIARAWRRRSGTWPGRLAIPPLASS